MRLRSVSGCLIGWLAWLRKGKCSWFFVISSWLAMGSMGAMGIMKRLWLVFALVMFGAVGCVAERAEKYQPHPNASGEWIAPILGSDPDVYERPNRRPQPSPRQPVCPGPNCPN